MPAVRALVLALAVAAGVPSARAQVDTGLFVAVDRPSADARGQDATVVRERWVKVDYDQMRGTPTAGAAAPGPSLTLNLFADTRFIAMRDRVDVTATGYVWIGHVPGVEFSSVSLAVTNGVMAGSIVTAEAAYAIRYVADEIHSIQQLNRAAFPPESPPVPVDIGAARDQSPGPLADDGSLIDLLVVYTPAARTAQGGTSAINALIDLGVSETNQAYANTGVIQRIRLVHKEEVNYAEAPSIGTDLDRIRGTSDGFMDGVHALRNATGADLVHLIVNNSSSCGIASLMTTVSTSFAPFAFGVTHYTCISPNYTLAHEMGHNMGLHHDVYISGAATGAFAYSHGYVNQAAFAPGAPASKRWRDIMAYNDQCAASGFNCSRLQHFANPNLTFTGDPLGDPSSADGRQTLDNTRMATANFRDSIPPPNLSINDVRLTEGNSGTRTATFTALLSATAFTTVSVNFATQDVTATAGDYVGLSGTLMIPAGSMSQIVSITINGDTTVELSETFRVVLSSASGANISDNEGIGTIINDDFTDDSLGSGSVLIKAVHVEELRTAVNDARVARGLPAFGFSDNTLVAQATMIAAAHLTELRTALSQAYTAAGLDVPVYTDPALAGVTVKAVHITELRTAVIALESS